MICPSCFLDFKSYTAVSLHYRNKHGTSVQFREIMRQKYVDENHGGITPTCKCGCGVVPKYYDYERGYVEFVKGHHARVHNNWGHNDAALQKSQNKRREQIAAGEWIPWNKGETKESSEAVAAYGRGTAASFTLEKRERYSKTMQENRLSGVVSSPVGAQHGAWKGGTSALQALTRSHLHARWTYPKLRASNFTCQKCGLNKVTLNVHHDQERFSAILYKAIQTLGEVKDDSFEQKCLIADWVTDYHLDNDVSGIVLCEKCHEKEHASNNSANRVG